MRSAMVGCLITVTGTVSIALWYELRLERAAHRESRMHAAEVTLPADQVSSPAISSIHARIDAEGFEPTRRNAENPVFTNSVGSQDHLRDPNYRRARALQLSHELRETYPWVASEVGLDSSEVGRLLLVLAEFKLRDDEELPLPSRSIEAPISQEQIEKRTEIEREREAAIRAAVGEMRYAKWILYNERLPAYQRVFRLGRSLEAAGLPSLVDEQRHALLQAYISGWQLERTASSMLNSELGRGLHADEGRLMELTQDLNKQRDQARELVLDVARRELSPDQAEVLAAAFHSRDSVRGERTRLLREDAATNGLLLRGESFPEMPN